MVVRAGFVLGNENFRRQVEALSGTPQTRNSTQTSLSQAVH